MPIFKKARLYDIAGYAVIGLVVVVIDIVVGFIVALATKLNFTQSVTITIALSVVVIGMYIGYRRRLPSIMIANYKTRKVSRHAGSSVPSTQLDEDELPPVPPVMVDDYYEIRHWLFFSNAVVLVTAILAGLLWLDIFHGVSMRWWVHPVAFLIGALALYRRWYVWRNRPFEVGRKSNIFRRHQKGTIWLIWLWLGHSEPDNHPLPAADLITPRLTIFEMFLEQVFGSRSATLSIPIKEVDKNGKVTEKVLRIRYIRDVYKILAIQEWLAEYRLYVSEATLFEQRQQTRLQRAILAAQAKKSE